MEKLRYLLIAAKELKAILAGLSSTLKCLDMSDYIKKATDYSVTIEPKIEKM